MKEVIVTISPDGTITIDINGMKGPACRDITKALSDALGIQVFAQDKPEMYHEIEGTKQYVGTGG